ncbi:hypothetical protein [Xylophilus sp. GOD-11R]|uniref:hypothetical protein n=1 Tax=Xylophilus sp. GOD-11R TaxID=3089814 RepID=UPI00298CDC37|nr:hypothetical protein [Xylophilus sp. GOD-11R]WPB58401.1 hypothetical protein R9X41_07085 [Xylophilus sp. GOD-11R]
MKALFRIAAAAVTVAGLAVGCASLNPPVGAAAHAAPGARARVPSAAVAVSGAVVRPAVFDLAALQALPSSTETVGGHVYVGVSLWTLLNAVVGLRPDASLRNPGLSMFAVATGTDGYRALLSLAEIDPEVGGRSALVAWSVDGAALGPAGMARLVVGGDAKPGRAVANLERIDVFTAPAGH